MNVHDRRRRRRNPWPRRLAWALLLALVFAVGIALGQALEDNPGPASTVTHDQTFTVPSVQRTVTVTAP